MCPPSYQHTGCGVTHTHRHMMYSLGMRSQCVDIMSKFTSYCTDSVVMTETGPFDHVLTLDSIIRNMLIRPN